ncbi:hypothetical protein NBRC116602_06410 [Hyphomicrobiales bacterium 4NK60-0047b]|jgi:hypothetical protein
MSYRQFFSKYQALLFIPPLVLGVALYVWMNRSTQNTIVEVPEPSQAVRILEIVKQPYIPSITGFGRAEAVRS